MNNHPLSAAAQIFFTLLGSAIGAIISGGVGIWLFFHKRKRDAKDSFLVRISIIRGKLNKNDVVGFYNRTRPQIEEAVFTLHPFLNKYKSSRLELVWKRYASISPHDELKQINENKWLRQAQKDLADFYGVAFTPPKIPTEIINQFLAAFESVAK